MNIDQQLAALDRSLKDAQKLVDLGNSLERLRSNRDFRKLILEGYLEQEAVRLVHLKAEPAMQAPEQQASIVRDIDAIGALAQYFTTVGQLASMGQKSLNDGDNARELILGEGN